MAKIKKSWWGGSSSSSSSSGYKSSFFDWDKLKSGYSYTPPAKKQIVKPYMNWYDANKVVRGVHGDKDFIYRMSDTKVSKMLTGAEKADTDLRNKTEDLYKTSIPDHLVEDIYSIYYNKSSNLEFAELKDSNTVKFKILEKVNNSLLKIVSNNNSIASFMYTKEICHFLFEELLSQLSQKELDQLKDSMKDCNQGEGKNKKDGKPNGNGEGSSSKGKNKDKGQKGKGSKGNGSSSSGSEADAQEDGSEDDRGEKDSGGDSENESEDQDKNESGEDSSGEGDGGQDDNDNEKDGETGEDEEESDDDSSSDQKCQSQGTPGSGAGKSGHRKNPLTGHNAKENTSNVKDWKEKNQKSQKDLTREEALAQKIENIFSKADVQKRFDQAIQKADELMADLEKAGIDLKEDSLGQVAEISNLNQVRNDIHALTMNKSAIAESIKQILDNSKNYFSKKYKLREIDLLEADEIDEIYGIEYIHPIFKSTMLDRLSTEERKYQGKIE